MKIRETPTLIIGASIAGLATAASLTEKRLDYVIIEKGSAIAMPWRNHYRRLHLHTNKGLSCLPFKSFGKEIPRYPSRTQVIDYLEEYQSAFGIDPIFNTEATRVRREQKYWITETASQIFRSRNLVIATGAFGGKKMIRIAGMESFPGGILHSSEYTTGKDHKGKNVLVIGFGNSACEIALDLFEQGAKSSMSVRSPVNVLPRDIFGLPLLEWSQLLNRLPPAIADTLSAPLIRWKIGNLARIGLEKKAYGAFTEIATDRTIPVIDVGAIEKIREGKISLFGTINRIEGSAVLFDDGRSGEFDAIIMATGFVRNVPNIDDLEPVRLKDLNSPTRNQEYFGKDGLYFCGFFVGATGQINEISKDALLIANRISMFVNR